MAHIAFPDYAKLSVLPNGRTYSYILIPAKESRPTILFLHGFPSSSFDWRHQIAHFSRLGYGVLVPDLLGYGQTSKPLEPAEYTGKRVVHDLAELLDIEGLSKVHGVGHDFGSPLLGRFWSYFPHKLISCAFLSVPYTPPGIKFDIDGYNAYSKQQLGFEKYGYMRFMATDDSWKLLKAHHDSFTSLMYGLPEHTDKLFYPPDALSTALESDVTVPLPPYFTSAEKEIRDKIFSDPEAYRGPTNSYRVLLHDLSVAEEQQDNKDPNITIPVLSILEKKADATIDVFEQATEAYAKGGFKCVRVSGDGHWVQLQCKDEVNHHLEEHFKDVEGKS